MNDSIQTLIGIGPYLFARFQTDSYWPPYTYNTVPLRSLQDLLNFILSRRSTPDASENIRNWLTNILLNARRGQCIGQTVLMENQLRQYHVRKENERAWNAVVEFFKDNVPLQHPIRKHLPRYKRGRLQKTKYPRRCAV